MARAAVTALERQLGKRSGLWVYKDAGGDPVGAVARWDGPNGKDIRPVSRGPDGRWSNSAMPVPRPLYLGETLGGSDRVFVVEGEKCADSLRSIGRLAVTSAGGSGAADKADWSALAGRDVGLLADNDAPGQRYVDTVASILAGLAQPARVRSVELPGLAHGGDVADFIEAGRATGQGDDDLRTAIEELAEAAPVVVAEAPAAPVARFQPFPTGALPEPLPEFVRQAASAIGCDECMLALPLLSAMAGAIGNARRVELKAGSWSEPAILWGVVVARSGDRKSPPMELVLRPLHTKQRMAMREYREVEKRYQVNLKQYEKDVAVWRKSRDPPGAPVPVEPEEPIPSRYVCSDTTIQVGKGQEILENVRLEQRANLRRVRQGRHIGDATEVTGEPAVGGVELWRFNEPFTDS